MTHYDAMHHCSRRLAGLGLEPVLPNTDEANATSSHTRSLAEIKRSASRNHFDEILRPNTAAILVVNNERRGIPNYIGPNAFAEVAVAFSAHKAIYLLHGLYPMYAEELEAWSVVPLHGNVEVMARLLNADHPTD